MTNDESNRWADGSPHGLGEDPQPRHYTREPWWIVPFAGLITGLLPLVFYFKFKNEFLAGVGLAEAMTTAAGFGMIGSAILVARSHFRSAFWANVFLWFGILSVTLLGAVLVAIICQ